MEALQELVGQVKAQNDAFKAQSEKLDKITARQEEIDKQLQKAVYPPGFDPNKVTIPATPKDPTEEGRFGGIIKSMGHFLMEVRRCPNKNTPTETLRKGYEWYEKDGLEKGCEKAIVGANETFGSDGGFLVPPEFSNKIFERVYKDSALLPKCDNYTVMGNTMTFPRSSETSRANGSRWGGVVSTWVAEGAAGTLTKPGFGTLALKLNKLMTMGGITSELEADQSVMPQYMLRTFSKEIDFMISDAIYRGTGAGQPLGLTNAPCKITVSKEAGQLADTINAQNVVNMFKRRFGGGGNYVWLYNQDIEGQLFLMTLGIGTAGVTVFMPPGGLSTAPFGTLMGRPLIPIEQADTLGNEGDLMLVDLSQYVTIAKGGINSAQSIHFYFDTDQTAFRMTTRLDGQPWWSAALTPYKGTNTQSPIITLEAR